MPRHGFTTDKSQRRLSHGPEGDGNQSDSVPGHQHAHEILVRALPPASATPFPCGSLIHSSTPVYPGALRTLLRSWSSHRCADPHRVQPA